MSTVQSQLSCGSAVVAYRSALSVCAGRTDNLSSISLINCSPLATLPQATSLAGLATYELAAREPRDESLRTSVLSDALHLSGGHDV